MFRFESSITWIDHSSRATTVSAQEFKELSLRYAAYFQSISEERVCIFWEPSIHALSAFVGAMLAHKIPSFFTVPNLKLNSTYFNSQLEGLKKLSVITVGSPYFESLGLDRIVNITDIKAASMPTEYSADFMQFSSGTTGLRKSIFYRGTACKDHNNSYARALSLKPKERIITWLPHYHDMGLIACFLMPLQLGYDLVCMSNLTWVANPQIFSDVIKKYQGTAVWQPNFAYQMMAQRCPSLDLSSTRFISCAEPVFDNSSRLFEEKFNTSITACYALAENVFAVTQASDRSVFKGMRSSGQPIGDVEIKIVEEEIVIKSSHLFSGYQSGESSRIVDGWYYTGDRGIVVDKNLFVFGRIDDSFKIRGEMVIPEFIEAEANLVNGIKPGRVACIPYGNSSDQNQLILVVYEGSIEQRDLHLKLKHLGVDKCLQVPENWLIKSSSGKISRLNCRKKIFEENIKV